MQVCLNGHQITATAATAPAFCKPFCPDCGAETIMACPTCKAAIQGFYHIQGVFSFREPPIPNNCHQCGTAYPWRQAAIANAIEVLQMELEGHDAASIPELVAAASTEVPGTQIAALKLKRILPKIGKTRLLSRYLLIWATKGPATKVAPWT